MGLIPVHPKGRNFQVAKAADVEALVRAGGSGADAAVAAEVGRAEERTREAEGKLDAATAALGEARRAGAAAEAEAERVRAKHESAETEAAALREQLALKQSEVDRLSAAVTKASDVAALVKAGGSEADAALAAQVAALAATLAFPVGPPEVF